MSETRKVKVSKRSGFDKHFRNSLTGDVGTLIPIFFDEVIPDSKVNLKINLAAALPPLVSDTYMNVKLRVEAFAVPHRLLYGNFEDFFADYPPEYIQSQTAASGSYNYAKLAGAFPLIMTDDGSGGTSFLAGLSGPGSLLDYLGYSAVSPSSIPDFINVAGPAAYHLIWQEWYRNPRVQRPAFMPSSAAGSIINSGGTILTAANLPYVHCHFGNTGNQPTISPDTTAGNEADRFYLLADGVNILSLRQRNFDLDYFTSAMPEPQQGPVAKVAIDSNNEFTISSLRTQNSIQQFRERNNLTSPRYQQQIYARYGTAPSDGVLQRPALIGTAEYDVYSHGVVQNSSSVSGAVTPNPYGGKLGSRAGNGFAAGSDFIIKGFHAKEPMFIMVLVSLVPDVTYSQGIERVLQRYIGVGSIVEMANNILQNVGPQPIYGKELVENGGNSVFAWADRYADWMIKKNQLHGEFRYGRTLENFVLQRHFSSVPQFGSQFLEIPKDYLDGVMTVTAASQGFAFWMDSMLEYFVSQPIQEYAIPTLQDPAYEHGRSIVLRKNGQLL